MQKNEKIKSNTPIITGVAGGASALGFYLAQTLNQNGILKSYAKVSPKTTAALGAGFTALSAGAGYGVGKIIDQMKKGKE